MQTTQQHTFIAVCYMFRWFIRQSSCIKIQPRKVQSPFTAYLINTLHIVTQTAARKTIKYSRKFATKAQSKITRDTEVSVFYRLLGGHAAGNWHNAASAGSRIPPFRRGAMSSFSGINRYPLVHVMLPNRRIPHVPLRPFSSLLPVTCILCPDIFQKLFSTYL